LGFGYSFEIVYNDDGLVSVSTSNGSADLETERKRLEETYQGNVENYINTVKALCED
jgi:CMP-N-acetylneuraminic acid synthetase